MKSVSERAICTPMFTAALFTITKTCKQPKCSSTDEWIKKVFMSIYVLCLVAQSYPTLCNPMNCSTPGFPDLYYLPEFVQTHV